MGVAAVRIFWRNADAPAEDQRVGGKSRVVYDRPTNRWDADLIAIILNAGDYPRADAPGMKHAGRQIIKRGSGRTEAQHIGGGNGFGRNADHIADNAAHAGIRAAKRFDCRGMVMGLDFELNFIFVVKIDDAGIIDEG